MFKPNSKAILFLELTLPKSNQFSLTVYVSEFVGPLMIVSHLGQWRLIGAEVKAHSNGSRT